MPVRRRRRATYFTTCAKALCHEEKEDEPRILRVRQRRVVIDTHVDG
jgi:hypothetical protein